ncbi:hypothetical protein Tco_0138587 [Tanacetum coccineum]
MARKGINTNVDENDSEDSDKVDEQEETNTGTETPINPVLVAMKTPSLYRIELNRYGWIGPEDKLEKGFLEIGAAVVVVRDWWRRGDSDDDGDCGVVGMQCSSGEVVTDSGGEMCGEDEMRPRVECVGWGGGGALGPIDV